MSLPSLRVRHNTEDAIKKSQQTEGKDYGKQLLPMKDYKWDGDAETGQKILANDQIGY